MMIPVLAQERNALPEPRPGIVQATKAFYEKPRNSCCLLQADVIRF